MLILTIRTDKPEAELGLYQNHEQLAYETWQAHRELSSTILTKISELLTSQSFGLGDIKGIVAFKGPGSFTGLRIGITVANTLASAVDADVVGTHGTDWIIEGISSLKSGNRAHTMVVPDYGSDAHITAPKK